MGVNATTSVPVYADGEILDASRLNVTNSGIPVFATTTTRDAAFGGTGEKVLAEGQYAYIEATNLTQYYDGAAWQNVGVSGLTLIKTQTIGTAVSSVTVSDVFSSTYDNYKITITGGAASAGITLRMTLGSTTAGYYYSGFFSALNSASNGQGYEGNVAYWQNVKATTNAINASMEIYGPNLAARTLMWSTTIDATSSGYVQYMAGFLDNATQYTAFTLTTSSGTVTGGTIRVYGYQNS